MEAQSLEVAPSGHVPSRILQIVRRQPLLSGFLALILAGISQYMLSTDKTTIAALGYMVAAAIFVVALRRLVPERFEPDSSTPASSEPFSLTKFMSAFRRPASTPVNLTPASPPKLAATVKDSPASEPSFWIHWRYYTIADLLAGRKPNIPSTVSLPSDAPTLTPPAELPSLPVTISLTPVESSAPVETLESPGLTRSRRSVAPQAGAYTWTNFVKPQAVFTSSQGDVFVLDTGQNILFRHDGQGSLTGQWAVPKLPSPKGYNFALAPDGKTFYVADPIHHCVHVIVLT